MAATYWHKQSDKPLFQDLIWSRPENRRSRGKLLIIGGNLHGFSAPAEAYRQAEAAGAGLVRVVLPDVIRKTVGIFLEQAEFAASTPSGSFAGPAYGELALQTDWADGVLLAGDLGRNSETAILLEKFTNDYRGQMTITKDAVDYFKTSSKTILSRPETTIVCSLAQLQKLLVSAAFPAAVTFGMGLIRLVDLLHELTLRYPANILVKHLDNYVVASGGQVSSTTAEPGMEIWQVKTAAYASVWWLQNPAKPFEALTTAIYEILHQSGAEGGT